MTKINKVIKDLLADRQKYRSQASFSNNWKTLKDKSPPLKI